MTTQSDSLEKRKTIICHHAFLISIQWFLFVEKDATEAMKLQAPQNENPKPNIAFSNYSNKSFSGFLLLLRCCNILSLLAKLNHEFVIYKLAQLASIHRVEQWRFEVFDLELLM